MKTPLELVQTLISNPTNLEHVRSLTTEDVTYVSLNFDNPELHKVLPWTGTNRGPQAIVDVFNGIGKVWETKAFEVKDVIANEQSRDLRDVYLQNAYARQGDYLALRVAGQGDRPEDQLHAVHGRHVRHCQQLSVHPAHGTSAASRPVEASASDLDITGRSRRRSVCRPSLSSGEIGTVSLIKQS